MAIYRGPDLDGLGNGCQPALVAERNWERNPGGRFDEDRLAIAFEVDDAGNAAGSFRTLGCKAACHSQETPSFGRLDYGRLDVWQWLASRTNPVRDLFDQTDNPENPLYGLPGYLDDLQADPALRGYPPTPGRASYLPNFSSPAAMSRFGFTVRRLRMTRTPFPGIRMHARTRSGRPAG